MNHKVVLRKEVFFHWASIADFFKAHCYGNAGNTTFEDYPVAIHTSNTGDSFRSRNLHTLGLWHVAVPYEDLTSNGKAVQCKDAYDVTEQCKRGIPVEAQHLSKYLYHEPPFDSQEGKRFA